MSIALESFAVLHAVGKNADLFMPVRSDVDKAARSLFAKCIKTKEVDLVGVRAIRDVFGGEAFDLLVDGLKDAEVKSVLTRLDKHHPDLKTSTGAWRRERLRSLGSGATPTLPPSKGARKKVTMAKDALPLQSASIDEYRARGKKKRGSKSK